MKNLTSLLTILSFSFVILSCSKTDEDSVISPNQTVSLLGKWEVLIVRLYEEGSLSETYTFSDDVFMEFKSDGKMVLSQVSDNWEEVFTWKKLSETELLLNTDEFSITLKNKNELKLTQISGYPGDQFEYEIKRK